MVDIVTERIGPMAANSASPDNWLVTYPLNSEIEKEAQEKQSSRNSATLNVGYSSKDGRVDENPSNLCGTRRVNFPSSNADDPLPGTCESSQLDNCGSEGQYVDIEGHEDSDRHFIDEMEESGNRSSEDDSHFGLLTQSNLSVFSRPHDLRRRESIESCASVTEHWPRRPNTSSTHVCSAQDANTIERRRECPVVESPFEKSQLGEKGVLTLMSELSRHVCRLKEDMYVITFSANDESATSSSACDSSSVDERKFIGVVPKKIGRGKALQQKTYINPNSGKHGSSLEIPEISNACLSMLSDIVGDTSDPDEIRRCPFADSRQTFLELSQYRHFQFDSLRRAKHSSMMILFHLLHPDAKYIRPVCSKCDSVISEVRWHCNQCINGEFDVCGLCMTSPSYAHEHEELTPVRIPYL